LLEEDENNGLLTPEKLLPFRGVGQKDPVRDAAIVGIRLGRLRTVALADDLDEALARVDLVNVHR
jgi:hypothetical protein